jgi:hypothetical protein
MKKLTLISVFLILAGFLFGQAIQLDIPADEPILLSAKDDSKSMFKKSPYLIFEGNNTQMRVIWQLGETATCQISWGADSTCSLGNAVTEEYGDDHQHGYTITGLTPGTKYFYKVIYDDAVLVASFRTAPPDDASDLKFFVYGDTRSDLVNHNLNSQAMIADYTSDPDFQTISLFTGDHVTYGAVESNWQSYFFSANTPDTRKRMAEVPFISCLGNHELYLSGYSGLDYETALFGKYFPFPFVERRYWSFDYGPVHVTILDQYPDYYQILPPNGFLDSIQMVWVEQDLAATDKPWKIIILHEPGWSCNGNSSGYPHPNNEDVQNLLQPLCEQYGVQMVFAAHNHYFARACKNGVYHITTAGGGAPLYEVEEGYPNVMHTHRVHHYCKVEIEGETLTLTAITPDGEVIDEFMVDQNDRPEHLLGFLTLEEGGSGVVNEVEIAASGQVTSADEIGYYGLELVPGYHDASFFLENYYSITETVEIFEGTETQLDTTMIPIPDWVNDTENAQYINISPNPVSGQARLCVTVSTLAIVEISIYNTTGVCLKNWQFKPDNMGQKELQLDLRDFQAGIYFCRVQIGNELLTKKLIKVN